MNAKNTSILSVVCGSNRVFFAISLAFGLIFNLGFLSLDAASMRHSLGWEANPFLVGALKDTFGPHRAFAEEQEEENGGYGNSYGITCNGKQATLFVKDGIIFGGPDSGFPYEGVLRGSSGDQVIVGTEGDDRIEAGSGNDTVCALGGNDIIFAGSGSDDVWGGPGNNQIAGDSGSDKIHAEGGNNLVCAASGNDHMTAGDGDNILDGASGDDTFIVGDGNNSIYKGSGTDHVETGSGTNAIRNGSAPECSSLGQTEPEPENQKPTITLLGDNPINLTVGDTFTDPGATASDPEDGDITDNIIVGGDTVDINTAGTYVITYDVTDSDGASAEQVTRTVHVNPDVTECNDGIDNDGDGKVDLDDLGCESEEDDDETDKQPLGSIRVCKIIIDAEGNIIDGLIQEGRFTVSGLDVFDAVDVFGVAVFETGLSFNERFFGSETGNAECILFDNLPLGSYYYGEEEVEGSDGWQMPLYNDQFTTPVNTLDDFFSYSGELFTQDPSDDASRNTNADGHIALSKQRPDRALVVLNQFADEEEEEEEEEEENMPPTITVLGDNPINLTVGDSFTDPGATATDPEDGDLTDQIVISGDVVDVNATGTYIITYNVEDSEGLAAEEKTRTVNVNPEVTECNDGVDNDGDGHIDLDDAGCESAVDNSENEKPIITLLGDNPIDLTVGEAFTDPGSTATDTEDGDITDDIVVGGDTVSTTTAGTFVITYNVTDSDGAAADEVTRTVNVNEPEPLPQCSDGVDNDGDGKIDHPADPGCGSADDDDETDPAPQPTGGGGGSGGGGGGGGGVISGPLSVGYQAPSGEVAGAVAVADEEGVRQCPQYLIGFIRAGQENDPVEVKKLQNFLRNFEGFENVADTGIYDEATQTAVDSFQEKYFDDILAPWGHDAATTYVYLTTRKKVNEIYCRGEREFPLTLAQEEEVREFRTYLASLRAAASEQPRTPLEDRDVKDIIDEAVKDSVGEIPEESQPAAVGEIERDTRGLLENVRSNITDFFSRIKDIF